MCRRWRQGRPQDIPIFNLAIQTEGGSINTHENAILSFHVLAPHSIRKILLVTSAMHMPGRQERSAKRGSR
jgi:uncharacterized SAM-binding protein YcdF (DUF218 family)